jgi:predicted  nucleic acid-binding Zn-ribbon protein
MGPTNVALVKLFQADQMVRAAQEKLDDASKSLRLQERRVKEAAEKHKLATLKLREQQSATAQLELDLKTREAHIERLRIQQQGTKSNKEYQAFLIEINTEKLDKGKVEDQALKAMDETEVLAGEQKAAAAVLEAETEKLEKLKADVGGKLAAMQAEIDSLKPARDAAAAGVAEKWLELFNRLAERFDGEALGALNKPQKRREEYICGACNMDLVADVYNKLHSRDEPLLCPSCGRILFIPDELPPELAIHAKPKRVEKKPQETSAAQ